MKKILVLFFALILTACSPAFPGIVDTRPPTATAEATATLEATVEPATATPDPSLVITPTIEATAQVCLIKGNVASGKIYHLPGQPTYNQTKVQPENGDKWFCSEQEAINAGFRKAKR